MIFTDDLSVVHDDNGVFVDNSAQAFDYGRDSFVLDLVSADDYLYVGLYKPFKSVYAEMKVVNTVANTLNAEYWNGSAWVSLDNYLDLSQGLTRSGFIKWEKNASWAKSTVNGDSLFWVRFKPSVDFNVLTEVQGLNIVFSDDTDLQNEFSQILQYKQTLLSYVTYHQSVRDDIVQALRNKGNAKRDTSTVNSTLKSVTKWDLLDIDEVKKGAVYGCLAKIFFELSDSPEDKWYQRHKDYTEKANKALELYYLSLDNNDDGIEDASEKTQYQSVSLVRV